jgi:hypothetical protein
MVAISVKKSKDNVVQDKKVLPVTVGSPYSISDWHGVL